MEWITDSSVENCSKLSVGVKSLEDLVKVAIDLNSRVIHDAKLGKYFVLTEDMTYIHDPGQVSALDNKQQLGKLLIERGLIQPEQLETGLYYQKRIGCKLGESLIALGFIDETILYNTLAAQQNMAYYEINTEKEYTDTSWLSKMSVNKAKALQILPIGTRVDQKMVIACGETVKPGITTALKEAFGSDIFLVTSRPTKIYEVLDKLAVDEKLKSGYAQLRRERKTEAYERLSEKEWEQFIAEYQIGKINDYLFIKSIGLVDQMQLSKVPNPDIVIGWLTGKGLINGQITNLIKTLEKMITRMDKGSRQQKKLPELLELLREACYLTEDSMNWVMNESKTTGVAVKPILESNYMVSSETIEYAELILSSLKSLISKPKVF
jgi:hypothetical protein